MSTENESSSALPAEVEDASAELKATNPTLPVKSLSTLCDNDERCDLTRVPHSWEGRMRCRRSGTRQRRRRRYQCRQAPQSVNRCLMLCDRLEKDIGKDPVISREKKREGEDV